MSVNVRQIGGRRTLHDNEKNLDKLHLRLSEPLMLELMRLAAGEDRSLSDYVRLVLTTHVWGHSRRFADASVSEARGDET